MGKKNDLCRSAAGLFVRNLGWKPTPTGGYAQQKFYLGRDETKARLASLRLEQLWEQIAKRWERENAYEIHPTDRPAWDGTTLAIADAIRNGEAVAKVPLPGWLTAFAPESSFVGEWFDRLQDDISVIKIELEQPATQEKAEEYLQKQGHRLVEMGRRMLHKKAGGETLYAALDSYARWVQLTRVGMDKKPTLWCGTQGRQIAFLRQHLPEESMQAVGGAVA